MKPTIINQNRVNFRLVPMSPFELYRELAKGITDKVRYDIGNVNYVPPQFGGLQGQYSVLTAGVVLKQIDFDLSNSDTNDTSL